MFHTARLLAGAALFVLLGNLIGPVLAQPTKKTLTFADESAWRSSSQPVLSHDGTYLAYAIWPATGDGESIVRHIATGKEFRFPRGGGAALTEPKFTPNGKQVLLPLTPTKAEVEKAKTGKTKTEDGPSAKLAVIDIATGTMTESFPQSGAFLVAGKDSGLVIYRKPTKSEPGKTEGKTFPGTPGTGKGLPTKSGVPGTPTPPTSLFGSDLFIRDLATKSEKTIQSVSQFQLTRDGTTLVYAVSSKAEDSNGVFVLNLASSAAAETIKSGPGLYSGLTWDESNTQLAFLFDDSMVQNPKVAPLPRPKGTTGTSAPTPTPRPPANYRIFVWNRSAKPSIASGKKFPIVATGGFAALVPAMIAANPGTVAAADEVVGPGAAGMPNGWNITGGSLAFSTDGSKLFLNTAPKRESTLPVGPPRPDDFQLEVWHWKDERLQPMQKLQAAADLARTYSAVVLLDKKQFRQLSDENISVGRTTSKSDWALASDNRKYRIATGYGLPLSDYVAWNVRTGEKKPLLNGFGGYTTPQPLLSPIGQYMLAFDGKDWFSISVSDGKRANLTAKLGVKFLDEEDDHPGNPPPAAQPLWTTDGKFVLVGDRYDIWKLAVDGSSAENLTKIGRQLQIRFKVIPVQIQDNPEPFRGVDLTEPQLLAAENLHTRDTGFYRLDPKAKEPKLLIMGARRYGQPRKANNADVYLLTVQTFSQYPDYYITTPDFDELKRVTDINPKVKEFNWGKAELVHYKSTDGTPLTGVLVKPENFDPAKKYPLVVYIYERLSDNLHTFRLPIVTRGQTINPTFYASNGYLVLMPDIAYRIGTPGQSAMRCVLPAIQAVCDKGGVDESAIGINGQSWGGYQIAYMITQTDRFKAAVAGAPVSNMTSAYGGIRWGSGLTRQFQYEHTQSRIGATLWEAPMKYLENSPVFMADRVKTPLLMIHNDQDDAVPWYQGIEYYLALRRLEKECYLLNYNGQPHNLANRTAARDFAARMFQFFEHHLKGKPEPAWMAKGVPYLDREKDKEEIKKLLGTPAK